MKRFCIWVLVCLLAMSGLAARDILSFDEMYTYGVLGMAYTEKLKSLEGKTIDMVGHMAPPLKAQGNLLVLTRNPVALCPYCDSDADWPADIVVVYLKKKETFRQPNRAITVTGRLEVGSHTDPETGFVSQVRLVDAVYQ